MEKTKYSVFINKSDKLKAIKYCKEHNSLLSIEVRDLISKLAAKYDKEMEEK